MDEVARKICVYFVYIYFFMFIVKYLAVESLGQM